MQKGITDVSGKRRVRCGDLPGGRADEVALARVHGKLAEVVIDGRVACGEFDAEKQIVDLLGRQVVRYQVGARFSTKCATIRSDVILAVAVTIRLGFHNAVVAWLQVVKQVRTINSGEYRDADRIVVDVGAFQSHRNFAQRRFPIVEYAVVVRIHKHVTSQACWLDVDDGRFRIFVIGQSDFRLITTDLCAVEQRATEVVVNQDVNRYACRFTDGKIADVEGKRPTVVGVGLLRSTDVSDSRRRQGIGDDDTGRVGRTIINDVQLVAERTARFDRIAAISLVDGQVDWRRRIDDSWFHIFVVGQCNFRFIATYIGRIDQRADEIVIDQHVDSHTRRGSSREIADVERHRATVVGVRFLRGTNVRDSSDGQDVGNDDTRRIRRAVIHNVQGVAERATCLDRIAAIGLVDGQIDAW